MANIFSDFLKKTFRPSEIRPNATPVPTGGRNGGRNVIHDPFPGAWQRNLEITREDKLTHSVVYSCVNLIAKDISKLPLLLTKYNKTTEVWQTVINSAHSPLLRKPNHFQTRAQFFNSWVLSLLNHGNTFVYTEKDDRNVVKAMYILDPLLVTPLVSADGKDIFYEVAPQALNGGFTEPVVLDASEIIHDRGATLYHPLVGVSPIVAAAMQIENGRALINDAISQSKNNDRPSGLLIAPGAISEENIAALREAWANNQSGLNRGKVAILSDGMEFSPINSQNALNSQLIEQLKFSAETICSVFLVPPHRIGLGEAPRVGNVNELNLNYFQTTLQNILENIELLIDEALGLPALGMRVEFDTAELLRLDQKSLAETEDILVRSGIKKLNESRHALNLPPMAGGGAYLQMQNFSVEALAKRDALENPFAANATQTPPVPAAPSPSDEVSDEEKFALIETIKSLKPEVK